MFVNDKTLILMQGIPGSGKSTVASGLANRLGRLGGSVFSTDDFWYQQNGEFQHYTFDADRLGEAHLWNQNRVVEAMSKGIITIVVDNTNIKRDHIVPYVVAAAAHGYKVQVVRVAVDPAVAAARQADRPVDRQVPAHIIFRMHREMEDLL